jgi:hypothetical protein
MKNQNSWFSIFPWSVKPFRVPSIVVIIAENTNNYDLYILFSSGNELSNQNSGGCKHRNGQLRIFTLELVQHSQVENFD